MSAVHIRNVPPSVLEALKRRAARHNRSLQKELQQILQSVADAEPGGDALPAIQLRLSQATAESSWRREETYDDAR